MAVNKKCVGGCILFWYLLFILLLSLSFKTLTPLEAGIKINSLTVSIDESSGIFTSGRYPVGFWNSFISYPTTLQTIEMKAGGDDSGVQVVQVMGGQPVRLEISMQFRLKITSLLDLFLTYEKSYKTRFVTVAQQVLKEVATLYTTTEYYTNRETIRENMHIALNARFQEKFFAVVEHFQLKNVDLPPKTENTIKEKLAQKQQVLKKEELKRASEVRETTSTEVSQYTQEAVIQEAVKKRDAELLINQADADAITVRLSARTTAYKMIKDQLNFTNTQLTRFLYLDYIMRDESIDAVALNTPSALFSF